MSTLPDGCSTHRQSLGRTAGIPSRDTGIGRETRAPMTERSVFPIYSITKPVTAAAVMMLYEAGRFSLTDPVSHALSLQRRHDVLGRLVETWSGQKFDAFLDERVFKPLGMTGTGFRVRPDQRARLATVYRPAPGGGLEPIEIEPEAPFTERPTLLEGAVGLVSTRPIFLRFSQMLLNRGALQGARRPRDRRLTPDLLFKIRHE